MATYVNDLRLTELATGEGSGTWGVTTNLNLELIGEALGYGTQDCFASDADATTTVADGASDPARAMYFKVTSSATLTATRTLTIAPNTVSRVMLIENATTGSQSISISQGSGGNVTIASGQTKMVYLDGAGATGAVVDALADLELGTITVADLTATTADINGGTIDGATIATSDITVGAGKTLDVSAGTLTLANDQISGDAINGGTATPTNLTVSGTTSLAGASTSADITFGDNDKAIFGAGSDLEIYHNGSNSYIKDSGSGYLILGNSDVGTAIQDADNNNLLLTSADDIKLGYNGGFKLATTATGIDVTGTAVTDGVTVDGVLEFVADASFPTTGLVLFTNNYLYQFGGSSGIIFSDASGTNEIARFTSATVTFNEDGNDQDFRVEGDTRDHLLFVDAGNDRVGIGSSSPSATLTVSGDATDQTPVLAVIRNQASASNDTFTVDIDSSAHTSNVSSAGAFNVDTSGGKALTVYGNGNVVVNDDSADADFRVESDTNTHALFVDAGANHVNIGTSTDFGGTLNVNGGAVFDDADILDPDTMGVGRIGIGQIADGGVFGGPGIGWGDTNGETAAIAAVNGVMYLGTGNRSTANNLRTRLSLANTECIFNDDSNDQDFRVESIGNSNMIGMDASNNVLGIGKFGSTGGVATKGAYFNDASGNFFHFVVTHTSTTSNESCIYVNRQSSDGNLVAFRQADAQEGTISVSGSTVSYNGFAGRHESSGVPTTTVKGTVVSTIDELDVYVSGPKQGQTRADHAKVKISDTAGESCVYGVVDDFTEDGKVNVISVGIGSVLVTGPCNKGDLLESNGDGTARVQSDDIVRSKTIGKVTIGSADSGVKPVSCVLYCG